MKITHALEATKGPRTFTITKDNEDVYVFKMVTDVAGEDPIIGGCRLSRAAVELLAATATEFLENMDEYKVEP